MCWKCNDGTWTVSGISVSSGDIGNPSPSGETKGVVVRLGTAFEPIGPEESTSELSGR